VSGSLERSLPAAVQPHPVARSAARLIMLASSLLRTSVRVAPRVAAPFVFGARGLTSVAALPQAARLPRARWTIGAALALAAAATYAYTQHNEIMAAEGNGLSSKEFVDLKLVKVRRTDLGSSQSLTGMQPFATSNGWVGAR
jgi:hypothetical protein